MFLINRDVILCFRHVRLHIRLFACHLLKRISTLHKASMHMLISCQWIVTGVGLPTDMAAQLSKGLELWHCGNYKCCPPTPPSLDIQTCTHNIHSIHNIFKWVQTHLTVRLCSFKVSTTSVSLPKASFLSPSEVTSFKVLTHCQGQRCTQTRFLMFHQAFVPLPSVF